MSKQKVLIVCGGPDNEHEVSLLTGKNVYDNIDRSLFEPQLCLIDKQERWYTLEESNLADIAEWSRADFVPLTYDNSLSCFATGGYDIVFNALHGKYGEGGRFQCILDQAGVKYTGSGMIPSAVCMDKRLTSRVVKSSVKRVRVPQEMAIEDTFDWSELGQFLREKIKSDTLVIKSATDGSSFNVFIIPTHNPESSGDINPKIPHLVRQILDLGETALVQEFVSGIEVTCPVLGRGRDARALPVGQIEYSGEWFDYEAKYSGQAREIFPAPLDATRSFEIRLISEVIHQTLGCAGLTRADYIITPAGELYFLEINTSPGMTAQSLCPKSAYAHGWSYTELVTQILRAV